MPNQSLLQGTKSATSQHLGILKAKLAKLKQEIIAGPKGSGGSQSTHHQQQKMHLKQQRQQLR